MTMSQESQIVTFRVRCPEPRAWVVATCDNPETHVVEMHQGCPSVWSAGVELMAGERHCRYYAVDRGRAKAPVSSMGFSMEDRIELLKLSEPISLLRRKFR
jgi:hypothetical protein